MKSFKSNIEKDTLGNSDFRHALYTGKYSQLVLMSLKPGEEIGEEVHKTVDQFFRFKKGTGTVSIEGVKNKVEDLRFSLKPWSAYFHLVSISSRRKVALLT